MCPNTEKDLPAQTVLCPSTRLGPRIPVSPFPFDRRRNLTDPEGFAVSPYKGVNVRQNGGLAEVRTEQQVVPSQHEEDQTVLLPFPPLGRIRFGISRESELVMDWRTQPLSSPLYISGRPCLYRSLATRSASVLKASSTFNPVLTEVKKYGQS